MEVTALKIVKNLVLFFQHLNIILRILSLQSGFKGIILYKLPFPISIKYFLQPCEHDRFFEFVIFIDIFPQAFYGLIDVF